MGRSTSPTYCGLASLPFLTSRESFCECVVRKVSLTLRMRNVWSFISYLGRPQLLFAPANIFFLEYLSTGVRLQLFGPGSTFLLPQTQVCDQKRPFPWGRSRGREPRGPLWYLADLRHQDSLALKVVL